VIIEPETAAISWRRFAEATGERQLAADLDT